MAEKQPPTEQSERQFAADVNQAVQETEMEIFDEALDTEPSENDGDTSLEDSDEDIAGEEPEDEDDSGEDADAEPSAEDEEDEEDEEPAEDGDEPEEQPAEEEPAAPEERQRGIPPSRLKAEADARRQFEAENAELKRQLAEINGRMTEISARMNAPPTPQPPTAPPPKPDQFADPEGWERWLRQDALREARTEMAAMRDDFQRQLQQRDVMMTQQRVNTSFDQVLRDDGDRFRMAYGELQMLKAANMAVADPIIAKVFQSSDPGQELLKWWDTTDSGQDYSARASRRSNSGGQQRPRHETRLPESMRRNPPSLNAQGGGQRQQTQDPEMWDDSDDSIFRYSTKR